MKKISILLVKVLGMSVLLWSQLATVKAGVLQMADSETAICTVVKRVSIDLTKPLTSSNPIEGLATLPAVCNGRAMSKLEYNNGIRSLMGMGWQITSISHQVTPLGGEASSIGMELLISAVFSIERTTNPRISGAR